mmetsp:Transcript_3920/g.13724  ORF Transcript_3920/g.13724 Transcript_3920/m.13724 type:complete len:241 (+) Transcript_3920:1188-1910(+)
MRATSELLFASTISSMSRVTRKKGQLLYISRSVDSAPESSCSLNAVPMPSHTGRWNDTCVHAKIHGMARSDSTPAFGLRLEGRLPMFMRPSSLAGVACCRYRPKCGVWNTTLRYWAHELTESFAIMSRHSCFGLLGGSSVWCSVAAVNRSIVRRLSSSCPKHCSMTSPWMVTRREPLMVRGGWLMIARLDGPPPRPTVPPRPWKSVVRMPNSLPTAVTASCASNSAHAAAMRPASFPLSL